MKENSEESIENVVFSVLSLFYFYFFPDQFYSIPYDAIGLPFTARNAHKLKFQCCGETMVTVIMKDRAVWVMTGLAYNRIIEIESRICGGLIWLWKIN